MIEAQISKQIHIKVFEIWQFGFGFLRIPIFGFRILIKPCVYMICGNV
jgi:hypothetical protein